VWPFLLCTLYSAPLTTRAAWPPRCCLPACLSFFQLASRVLASRCKGALVINTGASAALSKKSDSLLPDGIISVEGSFEPGDVVELRDAVGLVLGRGESAGAAGRFLPSLAQPLNSGWDLPM
jgi:hypothetical protein